MKSFYLSIHFRKDETALKLIAKFKNLALKYVKQIHINNIKIKIETINYSHLVILNINLAYYRNLHILQKGTMF